MPRPRPIPAPVTWAAHSAHTRAGADPSGKDNLVEIRLHGAAESGTVGVVRHLLAAGADPNSTSSVGITPLQRAALYGKPAVVKLLLILRGGVGVYHPFPPTLSPPPKSPRLTP